MRFFCCVISCFVACHFVFCFMPFRMLNRLYCSFSSPLLVIRIIEGEVTIKFRIRCIMRVLFIRFVEGRGAIKFRIRCIMRVLFIRFVGGRGAIKFRIRCIMRVLFIRFVGGRVTIHFPLFHRVKCIISLLA